MLKVAVVGLGWWGRIIVGLLKGSGKLKAVVGVDLAPGAGEGFCRENGLEFSSDFEKTINNPGIDGVILCTPHSLHCEQILRAAAAKKHVFCEKPLSLTRADAARAIDACRVN